MKYKTLYIRTESGEYRKLQDTDQLVSVMESGPGYEHHTVVELMDGSDFFRAVKKAAGVYGPGADPEKLAVAVLVPRQTADELRDVL